MIMMLIILIMMVIAVIIAIIIKIIVMIKIIRVKIPTVIMNTVTDLLRTPAPCRTPSRDGLRRTQRPSRSAGQGTSLREGKYEKKKKNVYHSNNKICTKIYIYQHVIMNNIGEWNNLKRRNINKSIAMVCRRKSITMSP